MPASFQGDLYSNVIVCFPLEILKPIKLLFTCSYLTLLPSTYILNPLSYGIDMLK